MQQKKLFLKVESLNHETLKATILKPRWWGGCTHFARAGQPQALARGHLISRVLHAWCRMTWSR
jgi:hypothetical protein